MRSSFEKALERSGPKGLFSKIPWKKSEQWLVLALGKGALHWADLLAPDERVLDFLMLDHPDASGSVLAEHWKQEKKLLIGDHPLPDLHSVLSAEALIRWITERANENPSAHWAVILSGGTSSLMFLPAEGISIESARKKIKSWLEQGLRIQELNERRGKLCQLKNGGLIKVLSSLPNAGIWLGATSDIPAGSPEEQLPYIGGGPTYWPEGGFVPEYLGGVHRFLEIWQKETGFKGRTEIAKKPYQGDLGPLAAGLLDRARSLGSGDVFFLSGEASVPVKNPSGRGGRQSALAATLLMKILNSEQHTRELRDVTFLLGATDGRDGNSPGGGVELELNSVLKEFNSRDELRDELKQSIESSSTYDFFEANFPEAVISSRSTGVNFSDVYAISRRPQTG